MGQLLNVVDAFKIPSRGSVIVVRTELHEAKLSAGDAFELVMPTGKRFTLTVLGVERFTKCFTEATTLGILIGNQLDTLDGVGGSEIWINTDS